MNAAACAHDPAPDVWLGYTERYRAYCVTHGYITPAEQLAKDDERWPGGVMCGFILWMQSQWRVFDSIFKLSPNFRNMEVHDRFTQWLTDRVNRGEGSPFMGWSADAGHSD